MKKNNLKSLIREALERYKKGLHQAKPDDYIKVGVEETRYKESLKIDKIVSNDRLQDENGNIWNRDGTLFRYKHLHHLPKHLRKDKHVNAQLITQEDFNEQYKGIKVNFLRTFKWGDMDIGELDKIIDQLPIKQGSKLRHSRFKKRNEK